MQWTSKPAKPTHLSLGDGEISAYEKVFVFVS